MRRTIVPRDFQEFIFGMEYFTESQSSTKFIGHMLWRQLLPGIDTSSTDKVRFMDMIDRFFG